MASPDGATGSATGSVTLSAGSAAWGGGVALGWRRRAGAFGATAVVASARAAAPVAFSVPCRPLPFKPVAISVTTTSSPSDSLKLADFRALPVTNGRVLVRYQVEYVPHGVPEIRSFPSAEEVVRVHGEWRIARRVGEAAYPDWNPTSRPVDI